MVNASINSLQVLLTIVFVSFAECSSNVPSDRAPNRQTFASES
jgi:hypothetical protein